MPPKLERDESMKFLYTCFKCSDSANVHIVINSSQSIQSHQTNITYQIDWNAVGAANNLKPNAARMRFHRLRAAIEGPDGACTTDAANSLVTPTTEGGDAAEPTDTPVTPKKTSKTPKKSPAKKTPTANNESPTKSPTKRKKKEDSDDKPAKKTKSAKAAKNVKTEMEESEGVDDGIDDAVFHDAHDQAVVDEVEVSPTSAMTEA